jgi:hypothetical protein
MDTTIFLAQIWGLGILAVGIGVFVSRDYYIKVYRNLEKETLAVLVFGMAGIAAGVAHINAHSVWSTFPEIVISLLGWGLLIKGLAFAIAPRVVDKGGDWMANTKLIPAAGGVMLVLGAYLTWFGYFA